MSASPPAPSPRRATPVAPCASPADDAAAPAPSPAFAPAPHAASAAAAAAAAAVSSGTPHITPRCEGCGAPHAGTYGSGRFCSATCAKKVGARHKWAARAAAAPGAPRRPPSARRAVPDAPCECCHKLHDKSYGSGRFCSVHCARRVAATRKWEKSRTEKSKRLEAIRPAMLATPPPTQPCALPIWTGKRRRVVGNELEQLHISDSPPSFYVTQPYSLPQPLNLPTNTPPPPVCAAPPLPQRVPTLAALSPPTTATTAVHQHASYLPPQPPHANHAVHYSQSIAHAAVPFGQHVVYAPHASIPAYSVPMVHGCSTPPTAESTAFPRCVPNCAPMAVSAAGSLQRAYVLANGRAFEVRMIGTGASTVRAEAAARATEQRAVVMRTAGGEKRVENSESAARALLRLRETNGSDT